MKKFKALKILLLEYKKIDYHISMHKMFHSSAKLIVNDPDIDKAFRSIQNFRKKCLENYGWCPSHYLSTPALLGFNA